jgi:hypothetical protein
MYDAYGGLADLNWLMYALWCENFSECRTMVPYADFSNIPRLPDRVNYVWVSEPPWPDGGNHVGIGQRYSFQNDTLVGVHVRHYDLSNYGWGPLAFYDSSSTNGFLVEVWPDDGTGEIDMSGGPLAAETVPGGLDNIYPDGANQGAGSLTQDVYVDFTSHNLILRGPYHFTVTMTDTSAAAGQIIARLSTIDAGCGGWTGGSVLFQDPDTGVVAGWERTGVSANWTGTGLCEQAFDVRPEVCLDEFAECQNQILYAAPEYWFWAMCDGCTTNQLAHGVRGLPINRVEKIRIGGLADGSFEDPPVSSGNPLLKINLYTDNFGEPGAVIWDTTVTPVYDPGWNEVVIPDGVLILGDFFVGYEGVFPDPENDYFYGRTDADAGAPVNGGALRYRLDLAAWEDFDVDQGWPDNLMAEVEFCSVPVDEIPCENPGDDWTTVSHDYFRTGRSEDAIGDAWCDLNINWSFSHPTYAAIFNGPIIWNDMVVMAFSTGTVGAYYFFDLMTGAVLDSISTTDYTSAILGSLRCQPTIDMVDIVVGEDSLGLIYESRPVLFVGGGVANAVSAYDMTTVAHPTDSIHQLWQVAPSNGWLGHTSFMGSVRYPAFIVMGGAVYWGDDAGQVFAADAATGLPTVWAGPATLIGNVLRSGTTDGSQLFYSAFAAGVEGDVYAISAATGAVNWTLATGPDGLQASVLYGSDYVPNSENFQSGILYDQLNAKIWVNSVSFSAQIDLLEEAVMYGVSITDGGVIHTEFSQRSAQTHPILDARRVYLPTQYGWGQDGGIKGGSMLSFVRATGALDWVSSPPGEAAASWTRWFNHEGVLACEPQLPDIVIAFSGGRFFNQAYLSFFNADDGNELFHRRIDYGAGNNFGGSGAMGMDSEDNVHVIFADLSGTIYDLTKGDDRPRFEIIDWHPRQAVPFGTGDTVVTYPQVYTNTGCVDLSVTMVASDAANGTTPGGAPGFTSVRSGFAAFGAGLADQMTADFHLRKAVSARGVGDFMEPAIDDFVESLNRTQVNPAAMAVPGFLIENGTYAGDVFSQTPYPGDAGGGGFLLGGFDTADVNVHVHGALVNRGRQVFFTEFQHNDLDYFLNDTGVAPTRWPDVEFALIGGCLHDSTFLYFGPGEHNHQIVYNAPRTGGGLVTEEGDGNFYIDEIGAGSIQANYASTQFHLAYDSLQVQSSGEEGDLVSSRRVALNAQWWYGGSTENEAYISMQPDPNWIDTSCFPHERSGTIAEVWDGTAYQPLLGNMVATQMIDSVQDFWDATNEAWDWSFDGGDIAQAPFDDDLTMGLEMKTMHVGALDAEVLGLAPVNNGMIYLLEVVERNGGTVDGWKYGAFYDHDIVAASPDGGYDTVGIDRSVSAAWVYDGGDAAADYQYCQVKIPFGCGYEPIKNTMVLERNQSALANNATQAWDSVYLYASMPAGIPHGHDPQTADDQDAWYTYIESDIAPYDTLRFAIAVGGFDGIADMTIADQAIAPYAHLMNKMAGFGRGDVDNDNAIGFADIIYLAEYVNNGGPGPAPFKHLGDVDASGGDAVQADVLYLYDFYFNYGPCPLGDFVLSMDPADYQP